MTKETLEGYEHIHKKYTQKRERSDYKLPKYSYVQHITESSKRHQKNQID